MANKKPKGGKSKGGGRPQGPKGPLGKRANQNDASRDVQFSPQDRVEAVRPMWETITQEERVKLLTVDIQTMRGKANQLTVTLRQQQQAEMEGLGITMLVMDPAFEEILDEGIRRLDEKDTWKLWSWPMDNTEYFDADAFRAHITEKHIREDLLKQLPREDPKSPEKPAETAFRTRMQNILARVQQQNSRLANEDGQGATNNNSNGGGSNPKDGKNNKDSNSNNADGKNSKDSKDVNSVAEDAKQEISSFSRMHRRRQACADQAQAARDMNIELINIMIEGLEKEHEHLYQLLVSPIAAYVSEAVQSGRDSSKAELAFEDLEKLLPDDTAHIVEWLTEKVDALSTRLKAEQKEDEEPEDEENMGDVDLWALSGKDNLTVNEKWLTHLQDRLLGEDGQPRKAKPGEDPHHNGLVLEWVYGSIVSTAEKARDGAKRCLGTYAPLAQDAHNMLLRALEDQHSWEVRGRQAKELMNEMLKNRLEAQDLSLKYNLKPLPKTDRIEDASAATTSSALVTAQDDAMLPDFVIVFMLKREALLTRSKLHHLVFEHVQQEKALRSFKAQLRQGEPEFDRLKRELEEVKNAHRGGLDGAYRTTAEMERHRAQLADAAIEEQLEVQTAFREQGARLQNIYDRKQRAEYEMAKRETEIKQLQGWKGTVENLLDKFVELMALSQESADHAAASTAAAAAGEATPMVGVEEAQLTNAKPGDVEEGGGGAMAAREAASGNTCTTLEDWEVNEPGAPNVGLNPQQHVQLGKLRSHFHKDVRKQLYGELDDKQFFEWLNQEAKAVEKRLEENRVALQHLEVNLINTACDDPGATIGTQLALPLIQERLDARALESAAQRAAMAESEIIRMEMEQQEREAADREKRLRAKLSKKEKARSEKDKLLAEKSAKEAAENLKKMEIEQKRKEQQEEERKLRLQQLEELRKVQEEEMEKRRQELLSDENGYWRQRMQREEMDLRRQEDNEQACEGKEEEEAGAVTAIVPPTGTADDAKVGSGMRSRSEEAQQPAPEQESFSVEVSSALSDEGRSNSSTQGVAATLENGGPPSVPLPASPSRTPEPASAAGQGTSASDPQLRQEAGATANGVVMANGALHGSGREPPRAHRGDSTSSTVPIPPFSATPLQQLLLQRQQQQMQQQQPQKMFQQVPVQHHQQQHQQQQQPASASRGPPPSPPQPPHLALPHHPQTHPLPPPPPQPAHAMLQGHATASPTPPMHGMLPQGGIAAPPRPQGFPLMTLAHRASGSEAPVMVPRAQHPLQFMYPPLPMLALSQQQLAAGVTPTNTNGMLAHTSPSPGAPSPCTAALAAAPRQPQLQQQHQPQLQQHQAQLHPHQLQQQHHQPQLHQHQLQQQQQVGSQHAGAATIPAPAAGSNPTPHPASASPGAVPPMPQRMSNALPSSGAPPGMMPYPPPPPGSPYPPQHMYVVGPNGHAMPPMHHMHHVVHVPPPNGPLHPSGMYMYGPPPPTGHLPPPGLLPQMGGAPVSGHAPHMMHHAHHHMQHPQQHIVQQQHGVTPMGVHLSGHAHPPPTLMSPMQLGHSMQQVGATAPMQGPPSQPPPPPKGGATPQNGAMHPPIKLNPRPSLVGSKPLSLSVGAKPFVPFNFQSPGPHPHGPQSPGPRSSSVAPAAEPSVFSECGSVVGIVDAAVAQTSNQLSPTHEDVVCDGQGADAVPPPGAPLLQLSPASASSVLPQQERSSCESSSVGAPHTGDAAAGVSAEAFATTAASSTDTDTASAATSAASDANPSSAKTSTSMTASTSWSTIAALKTGAQAPASVVAAEDSTEGAAAAAAAVPRASSGISLAAVGGGASPMGGTASPTASSSAQGGTSWKARLQQSIPKEGSAQAGGPSTQQVATPPVKSSGYSLGGPFPSRGPSPSLPPAASGYQGPPPRRVGVGSKPNGPLPRLDSPSPSSHLALTGKLSRPLGGGRYTFTAAGSSEARELKLVKGLMNVEGSHNCFLNVIIQSLWHLPSFRTSLLQLGPEDIMVPCTPNGKGSDKSDLGVLKALLSIFGMMAAETKSSESQAPTVSPYELREALSALHKGTSAINIDLSEMHDAGEVLAEVLSCLHRAQLGRPAEETQDPQLPQRVRVRAPSEMPQPSPQPPRAPTPPLVGSNSPVAGTLTANGNGPSSGGGAASSSSGGAGGGYAAALGTSSASAIASGVASVTATIVHSLFGLDVQVPCPPEDSDSESMSPSEAKRAARAAARSGSSSAISAQSATQLTPSQQLLASSAAPKPSAKKLREQGLIEVQQYTKYLHLVPAQGLRKAYASLSADASFEDILREVELSVENASGSASSAASEQSGSHRNRGRSAAELGEPQVTLLRQPVVFTLAVVWETPQAPADAIRCTIEALGQELNVPSVFATAASDSAATTATAASMSSTWTLRSVVCYFGHHYVVFALCEELGHWLLFDDANISLVGRWVDVCRTMLNKRFQPSLLFYEGK